MFLSLHSCESNGWNRQGEKEKKLNYPSKCLTVVDEIVSFRIDVCTVGWKICVIIHLWLRHSKWLNSQWEGFEWRFVGLFGWLNCLKWNPDTNRVPVVQVNMWGWFSGVVLATCRIHVGQDTCWIRHGWRFRSGTSSAQPDITLQC
jgi:hypothetical protein